MKLSICTVFGLDKGILINDYSAIFSIIEQLARMAKSDGTFIKTRMQKASSNPAIFKKIEG